MNFMSRIMNILSVNGTGVLWWFAKSKVFNLLHHVLFAVFISCILFHFVKVSLIDFCDGSFQMNSDKVQTMATSQYLQNTVSTQLA